MTIMKKAVCLIAPLLLQASCGDDSDTDSPEKLLIEQQCTLTTCQAAEEQCRASKIYQCDRCWGASSSLVSSGGGFYDCTSICDSSSCNRACPADDTCEEYGFVAWLPKRRNEALYQACLKAQAREQRCSGSEIQWNCDAFARVERAEATRVYDCLAQTPCDQDVACNDLAPTGVSQRYCDAFVQVCGDSPEACGNPAQLDAACFNWQRDQVNDEILGCLELGCEAAQACINAFLTALE